MAYIQPTSEVWLCANVPLDPSYDNQLTFTSGSGASRVWDSAAQRAYFASKAVYHPQNYSIVKERDGVLRMSGEVSQFYNINYMYFVNPPFGTGITSKYFYAFVTQVEYVNPNTTFIYFELDYFQTWAGELQFMESVIEREHVEHDEMYANLEDEGIEVNDLEPYAEEYLDSVLGDKILVIGTTQSYEQIVDEIQTNGMQIEYHYHVDYPILSSENRVLSKNINTVRIYKNNQEIRYSNFEYDWDSEVIKIYGASEVDFDKITFYFGVKYGVASAVDDDISEYFWCVKGVYSNGWQWSQNGVNIPYDLRRDYPQSVIGLLYQAQIPNISNMRIFYNGNLQSFDSFKYGRVLLITEPQQSALAIMGASNVDEIQFDVTISSGDVYYVKGVFENNAWTFSNRHGF